MNNENELNSDVLVASNTCNSKIGLMVSKNGLLISKMGVKTLLKYLFQAVNTVFHISH